MPYNSFLNGDHQVISGQSMRSKQFGESLYLIFISGQRGGEEVQQIAHVGSGNSSVNGKNCPGLDRIFDKANPSPSASEIMTFPKIPTVSM
jgi:hypothetical protein